MVLKLVILSVSVAIFLLIWFVIDRKDFMKTVNEIRSGKLTILECIALAMQILLLSFMIFNLIVYVIIPLAYKVFK